MPPPLPAKTVSAVLEEIAALLELKDENPFKIRAYANAARIVEGLGDELAGLVERDQLVQQKGIGQALSEKISELVTTGRLAYYDELRKEFPPTIFELLEIPGLGPKKVKQLYQLLGIRSLGELEYACHENRLLTLEGFGEKSQANILEGIQQVKRHRGRFLISDAMEAAEALLEQLLLIPQVQRAGLAGSLRRGNETVKDIDLVASSTLPAAVMDGFVALPQVAEVVAHGDTKSSVRLASNIQVDLRVVADREFPSALHHFTGSKEHNTALRGRAKSKGLKINEYGLFRGEELIPCKSEADLFAALGLQEIPPELRENTGEIEAAQAKQLPKLITQDDIKGIFHMHTTESDGRNSLEEMVERARSLGYHYLGISDHSRAAHYANGLSVERLLDQHKAIDRLQQKYDDIVIFKGIESDILPDGSLDYPDDVLDQLDFVIASIHSRFTMTEEEMTKRVISAMSHPAVTILGHPTGRLLLSRDPFRLNLTKVLEAAKQYDVAVELNANPHRLDLDWRFCKHARESGVKLSINPDAHSVDGLADIRWGVGIARKGWLTRDDVFNTKTADQMRRILSSQQA